MPIVNIKRGVALACVCGLGCSLGPAAAATAATLRVSAPAKVTKGRSYTIKIHGTFTKYAAHDRRYLISLIQFSPKPCEATAQAENASGRPVEFYFASRAHPQAVGIFETTSPFNRMDFLRAVAPGSRRVCTYLYLGFVGPSSTVAPVARASAAYKVVK